jgi:hypothetical protein
MREHSGTPLAKKLGLRPGLRVCLRHAPAEVRTNLRSVLTDCEEVRRGGGALDFVMLFARSRSELAREFGRVSRSLAPSGMLWASWPKKASGVATDLDDRAVRETGLAAGLVDVKVCAVTEVWSALKFVRRLEDR